MNGRKGNQLRTHFLQKLQIVLIEKAEASSFARAILTVLFV